MSSCLLWLAGSRVPAAHRKRQTWVIPSPHSTFLDGFMAAYLKTQLVWLVLWLLLRREEQRQLGEHTNTRGRRYVLDTL